MAEIVAKYEHKVGNEIRQFPVTVSDVDPLFIWLTVHPSTLEQWHVGVPWSRIVADYLPERVKELLEQYAAEAPTMESKPEEVG